MSGHLLGREAVAGYLAAVAARLPGPADARAAVIEDRCGRPSSSLSAPTSPGSPWAGRALRRCLAARAAVM
jgi:hypothetical protein